MEILSAPRYKLLAWSLKKAWGKQTTLWPSLSERPHRRLSPLTIYLASIDKFTKTCMPRQLLQTWDTKDNVQSMGRVRPTLSLLLCRSISIVHYIIYTRLQRNNAQPFQSYFTQNQVSVSRGRYRQRQMNILPKRNVYTRKPLLIDHIGFFVVTIN